MTHLGSLSSALADGQLTPETAERALAHVAVCPECADDLAAARAARRALAAAFDVPVDPDLTRRLIALGAARPGPDRSPRFIDGSVPLPGSVDQHRLPAGCLDGDLTRRRVPRQWIAMATTGVGVLTVTLFTLGGQPDVVPPAHPAAALTVLGRAATTASPWAGSAAVVRITRAETARTGRATMELDVSQVEQGDLAAVPTPVQVAGDLEELGWTSPSTLPAGFQVTGVRVDPEGPDSLELDLTGDYGTIVVTMHHGRLDPASIGTAEPVALQGGTLHVLSTAPWHGVWQCGDTVIRVVAQAPPDALEQILASYPLQAYDAGVPARISRGWAQVTRAWSP